MKNIIFLINIKNPDRPGRNDVYDLSISSWKNWSEKNDCEVFVLDEPLFPIPEMSPIIYRHYVFDLLDNSGIEYNQICTVDADTIVHPGCPNFFELSEGRYCGVYNDGDMDWVIRSIENYLWEFKHNDSALNLWQFYGWKENIWKYINSGFMITNKKYRWLHESLTNFYWKNQKEILYCQKKYGTGTDQPLINLFLIGQDIDLKILPYQFNMQDLSRKNILDDRMLFTKISGIYHFNAIPGGPEVANQWISKTYRYLYG